MQDLNKVVPIVEQFNVDMPVCLSHMTKPLGRDITNLRNMFRTFYKSLIGNELLNKVPFISGTYENKDNRTVSTYLMSNELAISFAMYCDPARGFLYAQQQSNLAMELLEAKIKKLEAPKEPKLNQWQPLRWFLQESNVSGHLDKFTDRTNHRVISTAVFDREIKGELSHMVKFNGKALLFNPEYENEIKKIIFDN